MYNDNMHQAAFCILGKAIPRHGRAVDETIDLGR
jgi:hypothetical protein